MRELVYPINCTISVGRLAEIYSTVLCTVEKYKFSSCTFVGLYMKYSILIGLFAYTAQTFVSELLPEAMSDDVNEVCILNST